MSPVLAVELKEKSINTKMGIYKIIKISAVYNLEKIFMFETFPALSEKFFHICSGTNDAYMDYAVSSTVNRCINANEINTKIIITREIAAPTL